MSVAKPKKATAKLVSGYTLVEMMVAVALFTMVAMVSISTLVSINDANKKAQTIRAIMDNLNFSIENIARNLRIGASYHCDYQDLSTAPIYSPNDCTNNQIGAESIAFEAYDGSSSNNDQVVFLFDSANGQILKSIRSGVQDSFLPITPHDYSSSFQPLTVDYLRFFVTGTAAGDGKQPRVVILVGGTARYNNNIETKFQIQTSVSQRKLDS